MVGRWITRDAQPRILAAVLHNCAAHECVRVKLLDGDLGERVVVAHKALAIGEIVELTWTAE